jgi:hypothetical protein
VKFEDVEGTVVSGTRTSAFMVAIRPRFEVSDLTALKASCSSWDAVWGD